MSPGALEAGESVGFTQDRFNNPTGAIIMNPGFYILPPGFYFNNSYSFLIWAKVLNFLPWSCIMDCGSGPGSDNILIVLSRTNAYSQIPYTQMFRGSISQNLVSAVNKLPTNTWFHLAVVYDGRNSMMYVNGNLVANATSNGPMSVIRTKCYIGRSSWHFLHGDPDVYACFDDLMIYNRALSSNEVRYCMNSSFY